jgi:[glutamine synthetase] adenylyltransferase / [glutamine synthetase]-adenylyl-L-tyrosine phosphorylase
MSSALSSLSLYQDLPPPAEADAAAIGLARWREAAGEATEPGLAAAMRDLDAAPEGRRILASIFGNSPFLTQCCLAEPSFLLRLIARGHDATFAELIGRLNHEVAGLDDRAALMAALRREKRRAALLIALADLSGQWGLGQVTGALSDVAEAALDGAIGALLRQAREEGEIAPADLARSGLIVLGMGKLGARELNYSSDIDLILLFDAERTTYTGKRSVQAFFTGLAHELVRILAERTEDGYVFRTDLRLRPDPASTPPVVSMPAALNYYESAGQNWERAAMIKARPVAGDREAGAAFLAELRPFLWRKNLDFAAIQDIHSIKRQINAHRGGATIAVDGHDIKVGRGGIREIEFFAQTQQLIWGGRKPELRSSATLDALAALTHAGHIGAEELERLSEAYHFLRKLEHRLQMIDDAQTHSVPRDPAALRRVAILMGYATEKEFAAALTGELSAVESIYVRLFEEAPSLSTRGNLVFTGAEDDPETLKTLAGLGFAEPAKISAVIRGWHHGRYRATRSQRARELLTEIVPGLLAAFGASPHPDLAFLRFDAFLAHLPAGVQLFSLFYNNPPVLTLVAEIMGAGTWLADAVARRPVLLDAVLAVSFFEPAPPRADLAAEIEGALGQARHYEEMLDLTRRWVGERRFKTAVQLLRHWLNGETSGKAFSDIAETAIAALLPRATAEFEESHGRVPGGELVVLGLGKLGSREMTVTSDLDLILVYDAPDALEASDGPRPLPVPAYYARLSQRFINALTAPTAEGGLYDVDMRLRPSGNSGPLASSFAAFRQYHQELAWTWEQMALTRARVLAGPPRLAGAVMAEIQWILTRPRAEAVLALAVDDMRRRIAEEHRGTRFWDVKHRPGGLVDIEFVAQFLQLREGARHPQMLEVNTGKALLEAESAGAIEGEAASDLGRALTLWHNVQALLRLILEEGGDADQAPPALKAILAAGAGASDFASLKEEMEAASLRARARYEALIGSPAEAARQAGVVAVDGGANPERSRQQRR